MNFGQKKKEILSDLQITGFAEKGRGVARFGNKVVFVKNAVPGDVVDAEIKQNKKKYIEAVTTAVKVPSYYRAQPFCTHFGTCGGCAWQHFSYEGQIQHKEHQVRDAFIRLAGIENPLIEKIIPSQKIRHYRNRLDYTFSDREWMTAEQLNDKNYIAQKALGFHIPGMFDKILDIKECFLQPDMSDRIRLFVRKYAIDKGYGFFNHKTKEGFLRNLILRNTLSEEWMVIMVFSADDEQKRIELLDAIKNKFPEIVSINYIINPKKNDTFNDLEVICYKGNPFITEEMEGLKFRIGPKSFYQTNSMQAHELYKIARGYAALMGDEIVYDLYTGTGTIAQFIAHQCKKVIGIEYIEDAVNDANENARQNGISNAGFFAGDMKEILSENFFSIHCRPDVIITDPPRAGMHADVVKCIAQSGVKKIVYISCNPATQARDIEMLLPFYNFIKAQPVDMFPHTTHVENVALLELKNS